MTQAVRHIIIMVWGTGLALGYFACIARALRVRAERVLLNRQRSHPQRLGSAWLSRRRRPGRWSSDCAYHVRRRTTAECSCPSILSEINHKPMPARSPAGHHLTERAQRKSPRAELGRTARISLGIQGVDFCVPADFAPRNFPAWKIRRLKIIRRAPLDYSGSAGLFCAINGGRLVQLHREVIVLRH